MGRTHRSILPDGHHEERGHEQRDGQRLDVVLQCDLRHRHHVRQHQRLQGGGVRAAAQAPYPPGSGGSQGHWRGRWLVACVASVHHLGFLEWKAEQAFQTTSTLLPSPPSCRPISGRPLPLTFSFGCWARPRSIFLFLVRNEGLWCEWGDKETSMDSWSARRAGQWLGQGPWHRRLGRSGPAPSP